VRIRTVPSGSTRPERYLLRAMSSMAGDFRGTLRACFCFAVEMVIERFSADSASYPLRPVLTQTRLRRDWRHAVLPEQGRSIPCFPTRSARPRIRSVGLADARISLVQAEKIGLGHFPESPLFIRCNVALHPLSDMRACLFPIHAPPHHVPHELT